MTEGADNARENAAARPKELVDHFFRHEYGRTVSALARAFGVHRIEAIEDAAQNALLQAMSVWTHQGVPAEPSAWVYRVAHNAMLDTLRRDTTRERIADRAGAELAPPPLGDTDASRSARFAREIDDGLLRMLFVCCDSAIPTESQIVIALKTLCGFSTGEIALRLFTSEANVHKRLARARDRLRELEVALDTPSDEELRARISHVHLVIYLLFNEGYHSAQPDRIIRRELCDEALRLGLLLADHPVGATPETHALVALMCFHTARLDSRVDGNGGALLLEDQDRSKWDRALIRRGAEWLTRAARGESFSRYHIEAAIAAEHAFAPSFVETRWEEIASLYEVLERGAPSPLHVMNRAIAIAQARGPEAGLALLRDVVPPAWLASFYLWDATLGELERRAGQYDRARHHLERAFESAPTDSERALLGRRLALLPPSA